MRTFLRRGLAGCAAAVAASLALVGTLAAPAQASWKPVGHFELCARGNYSTYARFLNRSGMSSYVATPNSCVQVATLGSIGEEWIEVVGIYRYSSGTFRVGTWKTDFGRTGLGLDAIGTTDDGNHWLVAW